MKYDEKFMKIGQKRKNAENVNKSKHNKKIRKLEEDMWKK